MTTRRMTKHMRDALREKQAGDRATLYWSQQGEISCPVHMPYPGSDTWIFDRWMLMAMSDRDQWEVQTGAVPRCETCR